MFHSFVPRALLRCPRVRNFGVARLPAASFLTHCCRLLFAFLAVFANRNALTVILALVHAAFVVSLFGALMRLLVAKVNPCPLACGLCL